MRTIKTMLLIAVLLSLAISTSTLPNHALALLLQPLRMAARQPPRKARRERVGFVKWTGGTSTTNWTTGTNWSDGVVPDASDDVVILSGCTYYPVLTGSLGINSSYYTYDCKSLTMNGGSLTSSSYIRVYSSGNLTVEGDGNRHQRDHLL